MTTNEPSTQTALDPVDALDGLLTEVGLSSERCWRDRDLRGSDPIVAARHRLGASIGIPIMGNAVAAAAMLRHRGGPRSRPAHRPAPSRASHHPACLLASHCSRRTGINGASTRQPIPVGPLPHPRRPHRDGLRGIPAPGSQMVPKFLDLSAHRTSPRSSPHSHNTTRSNSRRSRQRRRASAVRGPHTPDEWLAHPQGALLATQPVIGLTRIGDAPPRNLGPAQRAFDGVRVLSFTHAIAGPTVGRTLAEPGADVLCATRPMDYEHDFIYVEANIGSRSANLDLTRTRAKPTSSDSCPTRMSSSTTIAVRNLRSSASTPDIWRRFIPAWSTCR